MILFLTDRFKGKRGGEKINAKLFEFFKETYEDVYPEQLTELTGDLKSPWIHAKYKLALVKKYSPELVVIDISAAFRNIPAIRWLKRHRKKIMTAFFGQRMDFRYDNKIIEKAVRFCENYTLKHSDVICVLSEFLAGLARRKASKSAKIVIARPGTNLISTGSKPIDTRSRNRQRPLRLLFVGACTKVKGLEYLIEALILKRSMDFKLYIAGEYNVRNSYYKRIKKTIEKGRITDKVEFLGFVQAGGLSEIYRNSSVYILPSLSEGYGISLVEALSFGLPIIASNAGAIPELVEDGINAILVEPENPTALGEAIMELVSDPAKMDSMSRANFEKAKSLQTWDMYIKELEAKLVSAIAEHTGIHPIEKNRRDANQVQ
jgi:glycosyltransferase involved in cell wall biosynthesis